MGEPASPGFTTHRFAASHNGGEQLGGGWAAAEGLHSAVRASMEGVMGAHWPCVPRSLALIWQKVWYDFGLLGKPSGRIEDPGER